MSEIAWHSPSEQRSTRLDGCERGWMHQMAMRAGFSVLGIERGSRLEPWVYEAIDRPNFPNDSHAPTMLSADSHRLQFRTPDGSRHNVWEVCLNTLYEMGNESVRLLAKLDGQCEMNLYVEGKNRAWLAGVMEAGREWSVYREAVGWEKVIALLRKRDDEPVVTSYSSTGLSFPGHVAAGWQDCDSEHDRFELLSKKDQWGACMENLRSKDFLEISPRTLSKQGFGTGVSAFGLYATWWKGHYVSRAIASGMIDR